MKVKCISNKGTDLRKFEYQELSVEEIGRFGTSGYTEFLEFELGEYYYVMGIVFFRNHNGYLLDSNNLISVTPVYLFEQIDLNVPAHWKFRIIDPKENIYPYIQAIMGYKELVERKDSYEKLIVELDQEFRDIYFRRKNELRY
jgi:hypothetical protein